ncbi:hypothetical protein L211DRAFT_853686 [Terfezia boudieri ATCC MYA-4762]|uniref:EKC/KEOPS complex subunit BUD32 n=1 Tax=Terfezia boudieri ATCC MYA-4762 TaxID=1051890 RepID=A0A3N4L7Q5_9PEZI|nr:hypothetical protein L211DRAFT_853686 [Terfezia boudieri ATCC MYA-4762]
MVSGLPSDGSPDIFNSTLPSDGSSKCSTPIVLSTSSNPTGLKMPNDVAITTTLLAPGHTEATGVAQASFPSLIEEVVPPNIRQQFLGPSTNPYLSKRLFHESLLDVTYCDFRDSGTSDQRDAIEIFEAIFTRIETKHGQLIMDLKIAMETEKCQWRTEKHEMEMEIIEMEDKWSTVQHENDMLQLHHLQASKQQNKSEHYTRQSRATWDNKAVRIEGEPPGWDKSSLTAEQEQGLLAQISTVSLNEDTPETLCYALQQVVSNFVKKVKCYVTYVTAYKKFLDGDAPDITICCANSDKPLKVLTYGIIEVKRPAETLDTTTNLTQLKDYILSLMQAQQGRKCFWGLLTNMKENILVTIEPFDRTGNKDDITKYAPLTWPAVIEFIRYSTQDPYCSPPSLHFATKLGVIQDVVGSSTKWSLGEFFIPGDKTKTMVVKNSILVVRNSILSLPEHYHINELRVLRQLTASRKIKEAPSSILRLVWDPALEFGRDDRDMLVDGMYPRRLRQGWFANDSWNIDDRYEDPWDRDPESDNPLPRVQFGITPVGLPFDLADFKTPGDFRVAMDSLLDGLDWLHTTARILHRDIRPANVIVDRSTKLPVIIDFDCACMNPDISENVQSTYAGGLICVPPKVIALALKAFEDGDDPVIHRIWYKPEPSDDLVAFVLLVLAMLYPKQFSNFPACRLQNVGSFEEVEALSRFHNDIEASTMWGTIWANALEGNLEGLRQIRDFGLWPTKGTTGN